MKMANGLFKKSDLMKAAVTMREMREQLGKDTIRLIFEVVIEAVLVYMLVLAVGELILIPAYILLWVNFGRGFSIAGEKQYCHKKMMGLLGVNK